MAYQEGSIVTNEQGHKLVLRNNEWVPFIAQNPETGEYASNYQQVFAGAPELTPMQNLMGGISAFSEGSLLGYGGEVAGSPLGKVVAPAMDTLLNSFGFDVEPTDPNVDLGQAFESVRQPFAEQHPFANVGLEIAGTLVNPLTRRFGAKLIASRPFLGSAVTGGAFGAAFGSGKAEPGERLKGGLIGGGTGAVIGGPMGYLGQLAAQKMIPSTIGMIDRLRNYLRPNPAQQQADEILRPVLQKAFNYADDPMAEAAQQMQKLGPKGMLMDISPEMGAVTSSAYNKQIISQNRIAKELVTRSKDAINRVTNKLSRTLGTQGRDYSTFIKQTISQRADDANPLYTEAYQQSTSFQTLNKYVQMLDERIGSAEGTSFGRALQGVRRTLFKSTPDGKVAKTSIKDLSYVRDDLADAASSAWKSGKTKLWRFLRDAVDEFDNTLMPESYRQANQIFSSRSRLLDAADEGLKFFNPSTKTEDVIEWLSRASESERQAYLLAVASAAKHKLGHVTSTGKVTRLFDTPNSKEKIIAAVGDPKIADDFINAIESENIFKATENLVRGNSFTDLRKETDVIFEKLMGSAMTSAPTTKGEMVHGLVNKLVDMVKVEKSISPEVSRALEERLLSKGLTRETIEMLMRTPAKEKFQLFFKGLSPQAGSIMSRTGADIIPNLE